MHSKQKSYDYIFGRFVYTVVQLPLMSLSWEAVQWPLALVNFQGEEIKELKKAKKDTELLKRPDNMQKRFMLKWTIWKDILAETI